VRLASDPRFLLGLSVVVCLFSLISARTQESPQLFKAELTVAPEWQDGCLKLSIDRVNGSSSTIFLPPYAEIVVYSSVMRWANTSAKHGEEGWVVAYGAGDIIAFEASALAPGETRHKDICLRGTIAVVDLKEETRREIPMRGKLRIDASYFPNEQDWLAYKAEHEELTRAGSGIWPRKSTPRITTLIVTVPCVAPRCVPPCDGPPVVLNDEAPTVPDILHFSSSASDRGRAVTSELSKSSGCDAP
jgi:hypothetical protein